MKSVPYKPHPIICQFAGVIPLALLVGWPFISFLASNRTGISHLGDVLFPWVIYQVLVLTIICIGFSLFRKCSFNRLCVVFGLLSIAFFSFGSIAHLLVILGLQKGTIWLLIWLVIFLLVGWLSWILSNRKGSILVSTSIGIALISWPLMELLYVPLEHPASVVKNELSSKVPGAESLHNVYWFLLDGYAGKESLKLYFDQDNQPFLDLLKEHSFNIATAAYSNYDNTTLSLTSTLNSDYQQLPGKPRPDPAFLISTLSGFNPVVQKFTALGYRYIHAPYGGSAKTQCGGNEYRCIRARPSGKLPLNETQIGILQLTPLFRIFRKVLKEAFQYDHIFVEDVVAHIESLQQKPFFLFAHILSPHAPPRFTPECKKISGVIEPVDIGESRYDPAQFRIDTECTNRAVEEALNYIRHVDKGDPIIILQGDHGFKFRLPTEPMADPNAATEGPMPFRRLSILNAIRLPKSCQNFFYDEISPINTFPLVFACIQGNAPVFKEERHYLRPWGANGKVVEVNPAQSRVLAVNP